MSKATVSRSADRITRIRFQVEGDRPMIEYQIVVDSMPDDKAKREWIARPNNFDVVDGWAEVTARW